MPINGGGEARWSGANDSNVIDTTWIDGPHQAKATRQFILARIAQELPAWTENDRQLGRIDVEAFDQRLGRSVGFGIEQLVRLTIAAQKTLKPHYVTIFGPTDDDRSARSAFEDRDAAQDQSAHDALPELGFRNHQGSQALWWDDECVDVLLCGRVHQRGPAR